MTPDEIAAAFQAAFDATHAYVDGLPEDHTKTTAQRLLSMFHHAGEVFASHMSDSGIIQPLDGENKPHP